MKKILILGATGMAGHMVYNYLQLLDKYKLFSACFRKKLNEESIILNVYDTEGIKRVLLRINPDYVINCVGILVNGSKIAPENAIYVNAYFPHLMTQLLNKQKSISKFIHISTDCVFSGGKGLYADNDIKDALDIYGMTKNIGEIIDNANLTIRTSIIGPEIKENGEGLFHWIFSQRNKNGIAGYEKSIWGGVTTLELAKVIDELIEHNITGLYQLSNGEGISKYALIQLIIRQFNLNIPLQKVDGVVSNKSILPSSRKDFCLTVPSYAVMIKELYQYMNDHKNIYPSYMDGVICNKTN